MQICFVFACDWSWQRYSNVLLNEAMHSELFFIKKLSQRMRLHAFKHFLFCNKLLSSEIILASILNIRLPLFFFLTLPSSHSWSLLKILFYHSKCSIRYESVQESCLVDIWDNLINRQNRSALLELGWYQKRWEEAECASILLGGRSMWI